MRLRPGYLRAVAFATLLLPLGLPGAARADGREIVVEGRRSAYADVEVRNDIYLNDVRFDISSTGTYAGMVFAPLVRSQETVSHPTLIALRVSALGSETLINPSTGWIKPGTYRVWILGDRPTRVVIPVSGNGFTVRPTRRVAARLHSRTDPVPMGRSHVEQFFQRAVAPRWNALVAMRTTGARVEETYACVTSSQRCASPGQVPLIALPRAQVSNERSAQVGFAPAKDVPRSALVGVDGVRVSGGDLSSAVVVFSP